MKWLGLFGTLLAGGCTAVEASRFATELAVVECRRIKKCARGEFEADYAGKMNDCVDVRGDLLDDYMATHMET